MQEGGCYSREKEVVLLGAPREETYVFRSENKLKLFDVDYHIFQGAIKRFGYRDNLNSEQMKTIRREIKLNVEDMNEQKHSPFAIVYKDEHFFFIEKRHTVYNLLKLGFMLCQFPSVEDQELEMWHLINPRLDETVSKGTVEMFLRDLIYVALDMNINILKAGDENEHPEKPKALQYLEEAAEKREIFMTQRMKRFKNDYVTRDELAACTRDCFFQSYRLRLAISGCQAGFIDYSNLNNNDKSSNPSPSRINNQMTPNGPTQQNLPKFKK
eukprot:403361212